MQRITVQELNEKINSGEQLHLIDVREPAENAEFNIGGTLKPLGSIMNLDIDDLDGLKNEEVILYCRTGNRSAQAGMMLESAGFTNVKNLVGGIVAWQQK